MADTSETSDIKIIDFGHSDFFGPSERPYGKEIDIQSFGAIIYSVLE